MNASPLHGTNTLRYDYVIRIDDCSVDPSEVVERMRMLMRRGGTRFLVRVPEGKFVECLDVVRKIHQSFLFISLNVVEGDNYQGIEVARPGG